MVPEPIKRWLKTNIHPTEAWFFFFAMVRFAAFTAWGNLIVRLIRGEEAKEDWRTLSSIAALITFSTLTSAAEAREFASLREAAVGMRGLVDDAAAQAELRDQRTAERDRRAAEQQDRMLRLNKRAIVSGLADSLHGSDGWGRPTRSWGVGRVARGAGRRQRRGRRRSAPPTR
jgi:hypothetical protein